MSPISTNGQQQIVDIFLRGLDKLGALAPEVTKLEHQVASREAEVLRRVLILLDPVFPRLAQPISLREPWLDQREAGQGKRLKEPGVILFRNFHQKRDASGAHQHSMEGLVLLSRGRLIALEETASWTEPGRRDPAWQLETHEVELTPELATRNLRAILVGILDVLREALARDVAGRRELRDRLERLAEAERALAR